MSQPTIESKEYWEQQLEQLKLSGLTRAKYCKENGVNYDRFGYWLAKLRPMSSGFVPVHVQPNSHGMHQNTLCTLEMGKHILKIHDASVLSIILDRLIA